jgi:translation initiation factor 1 (eIF-1/SUI1)
LRLEFLDADDVGLLRCEPLEKSLAGGGTNTIEIQGDYSEHVFPHVE